ncbi:hypothetical protein ILUMI_09654 [Ignelater luminosus]|uniref:Reverse transcriptase RNase H-like domain-containing protein n=1 Tax=Ignelater luminosus TaxID=2038154 RepID=A0A8K0D3T5_IGNLU|nr:hypothetical protein ILUMI_09654 [Ignelater luminosus]
MQGGDELSLAEQVNISQKFFALAIPNKQSTYRDVLKMQKYLDHDLVTKTIHESAEEFNISFGYLRKDISNVSTKFLAEVTRAQLSSDEAVLHKLELVKEIHLRRGEVFKNAISAAPKSPENPIQMILCFDFEKSLPLPVTNAKARAVLEFFDAKLETEFHTEAIGDELLAILLQKQADGNMKAVPYMNQQISNMKQIITARYEQETLVIVMLRKSLETICTYGWKFTVVVDCNAVRKGIYFPELKDGERLT